MLKDIICKQVAAHPSCRPADLIKLCFQASFGAEHLLLDFEGARAYLMAEFESTNATDEPLFEEISPYFARVNIGAVKRMGVDPDLLFKAFFLTASEKAESGEDFNYALDLVGTLAQNGALPFSHEEWDQTLKKYLNMGGGPVHHSTEYRAAEHPSYRVVAKKYITLLKENEDE